MTIPSFPCLRQGHTKNTVYSAIFSTNTNTASFTLNDNSMLEAIYHPF